MTTTDADLATSTGVEPLCPDCARCLDLASKYDLAQDLAAAMCGTKGPHLLVGIGVILCETDWAIDSAVI